MTLPTHAVTGLLIGTLLGYPIIGLVTGCFPDIDHLYSYVKHGYFKNWKVFYKYAFGKDDVTGDQRNILHNVLIVSLLCLLVFFTLHKFFAVFSLAYISHIILDAVDTSDYFPFYPSKIINIKGFLDFYSYQEGILFSVLLIIQLFVSFY